MTKSRNCCMCKRKSERSQYSLHSFPKDDVLRKIWKTACGYEDYDEVSTLFICSAHFKDDDYADSAARLRGGKSRLKPGVYPTVEMPVLIVTKTAYESRSLEDAIDLTVEEDDDVPGIVDHEEHVKSDSPEMRKDRGPTVVKGVMVKKRVKRVTVAENGMSKVDYQNYKCIIMSRCRLCQLKDGTIPLSSDKKLAEYVAQFTRVNADNAKKYPDSICEPCSRVIDAFTKFVKIVDCVNVKLTRFITNGKFIGAETDEIVNMLNESPLLLHNYSVSAFPSSDEPNVETVLVQEDDGTEKSIKLPEHGDETGVGSETADPNEFPMLLHNYAKPGKASDEVKKTSANKNRPSEAKPKKKRTEFKINTKVKTKILSVKSQGKDKEKAKEKVPYICELCGESFTYQQTYKKHKLNHTGWFKCKREGCDKVYICYRNYKDHLYRHSVKDRKTQQSLESRAHECRICKVAFETRNQLWQHQPTHENIQCTYKDCDQVLATWNCYQQHLATHEPYLCSTCGKTFVGKSSLYMHEYYNHQNKVHKCTACNRSYKNKSILNEHINVHHKGILYLCASCPKTFLTSLALKRHTLVHTGVKPFQCTNCSAAFYTKPELKKHAVRHTGVKDFVCLVCNKKFYLKASLKKHERTHSEESFLCSIDECYSTFFDIEKLERHISEAHISEAHFSESHLQ